MDLWANVQKHKHKWTGPQLWLFFWEGWGVLMFIGGMILVRVTVRVRLSHSRGRRMMRLMKVELRFTVLTEKRVF